jgi:hypothetical protein
MESSVHASVHCPVCAFPMGEVLAGCTRCATPHHDDCFALTGTCAVFGCGGDDFGPIKATASTGPLHLSETTPDVAAAPRSAHRPRGTIRRIADAWRLFFEHGRLLAGVALVAGALGLPFNYLSWKDVLDPSAASTSPGPLFLASLVSMLAWSAAFNVIFIAVSSRMRGKERGTREIVRLALERVPRAVGAILGATGWTMLGFIGATLLSVVLMGTVIGVGMLCAGMANTVTTALFYLVLVLAGIGPRIWWMIWSAPVVLVACVAADDPRAGEGSALVVARQLVGRRRFRTLVDLAFSVMLSLVPTMFLVIGSAFVLVSSGQIAPERAFLAGAFGGYIGGTFFGLVNSLYMVLQYLDCRAAQERRI